MLDANRVFRDFRDIKMVFRAGFCATMPGLSHAESKAYEFLYSVRARIARVRDLRAFEPCWEKL
jgi:hypothetical protein